MNLMNPKSLGLAKIFRFKFRAKLIWFAQTQSSFSIIEMYLTLLISYLQIFFMSTRFIRDYTTVDFSSLRIGVKYLEDIITFDNLFGYATNDLGLLSAFIIIVVYFLVLLTSFILLVKAAKSSQQPNVVVIKLWSFITRIHNPVLFFLINNLCVRVQREYIEEDLNTFRSTLRNQVLFFLSIPTAFINLTITLFTDIFFSDSLPSKNPMASKNSHTDQITVCQKAALVFLWRFLPADSLMIWFIIVLNLSLSVIKQYLYYYTLPRYNIKTLKFNAYMLTLEASVVFLTPIRFVINSIQDNYVSVTSTIMIIVLLLPFLLFCTREIVNNTLKKVIYAAPNHLNAQKLIHKLILLKHMKAYKNKAGKDKNHVDINLLYFACLASNREKIFQEEDKSMMDLDFNDKDVQNWTIRHFLERIEKHHPNDNILKLTLTSFYTKCLGLYPLAISSLSKVNSFSPRINVSVDLLSISIQEEILKHYKDDNSTLDLSEYLTTINQVEDFQDKIRVQLDLHKQFWNEYTKNNPDTTTLHIIAEKVNKQKKIIQGIWGRNQLNKNYTQPYLLYAYYLFALNDSRIEGRKCLNSYNLLTHNHKGESESQVLSQTNLYSDETFFITIRTDPKHIGTIVKCSLNIQNTLHYNPKTLKDLNISKLMVDHVGQNHSRYVLQYIRTGESKTLNRIRHEFVKDRLGFLHKAWLYPKVHPSFDKEIYLTGIIKPIKTFEEYIMITPQGQIDCTSMGIAEALGIVGKKIAITSICREFQEINEAFNYYCYKRVSSMPEIQRGEKSSSLKPKSLKLDEKILDKVYKKWDSEGDNLNFVVSSAELELSPLISNTVVECFCQVHPYYFGSDFMKLVVIHKMNPLAKDEPNIKFINHKVASPLLAPSSRQMEETGALSNQFSCDFIRINEREDFKDFDKSFMNGLNSPKGSDSQNKIMLSSQRQLNIVKSITSSERHLGDIAGKLSDTNRDGTTNYAKKVEPTNDPSKTAAKHRPYVASSTSYATSRAKRDRIHNQVNNVLNKRNYPTCAYILLFFCFCFGATIFSTEMALYYKVGSDLNTLEALGTTLDLANTVIDALLFLSRGARLNFLGQLRVIDVVNSTQANNFVKTFGGALTTYLPILKKTNNELWAQLQEVDENFRVDFLTSDIRFFDFNTSLINESSRYVSTLTGTTLLENKLYQVQYQTYGNYLKQDLMYIFRNSCGDLLLKNKNFALKVQKYLEDSINEQHNSLNIYFGLGLLLLSLGLGLIFYFSYRFYTLEQKRLQAFVGLSELEIKLIQESLNRFEETMKTQTYHRFLKLYENSMASQIIKSKIAAKQNNRHPNKIPNTARLKRKYIFKVLSWVIILIIFAIFMTVIYTRVYDNGSNFRLGVNRLVTVQRFMNNLQLSIIGFYSSFINQYEGYLEDQATLNILRRSLNVLSESTTTLTNAYNLIDGTLDPVIAPIFSGNICNFVPAADLAKCLAVTAGAQSKDIFTFINDLYVEFSYGVDQYLLLTGRPFQDYQSLITRVFVKVSNGAICLRDVLMYMIAQARVNFHQIYDKLISQLTLYVALNILLFVVLVMIAWFHVLKYLMDYNNRVKRLLTMIPIDFLTSNRFMKPLLIKSCRNMLGTMEKQILSDF